jgi:hypothetical protein
MLSLVQRGMRDKAPTEKWNSPPKTPPARVHNATLVMT